MEQVDIERTVFFHMELEVWRFVLEIITGVDRFTIMIMCQAEAMTQSSLDRMVDSGALRSFLFSQKGD